MPQACGIIIMLGRSMEPLTDLITGRGFDRYQDGLRSRFAAYRLDYELTYCTPTDNPAMRLDFQSPLHVGRVTVWESGACDMEVLDVATGDMVFYEHHELAAEKEFHEVYPRLVIFMREATGWPHVA